ncbi:hypothetical protein LguiB_017750 [Lonicera macranthoides]
MHNRIVNSIAHVENAQVSGPKAALVESVQGVRSNDLLNSAVAPVEALSHKVVVISLEEKVFCSTPAPAVPNQAQFTIDVNAGNQSKGDSAEAQCSKWVEIKQGKQALGKINLSQTDVQFLGGTDVCGEGAISVEGDFDSEGSILSDGGRGLIVHIPHPPQRFAELCVSPSKNSNDGGGQSSKKKKRRKKGARRGRPGLSPGTSYPHGFIFGSSRPASQGVTHPGIALVQARLTSEFSWDPKPVSLPKGSLMGLQGSLFELYFLLPREYSITRRASHPFPQGNRRPRRSLAGRHILSPKGIDVLVDTSYSAESALIPFVTTRSHLSTILSALGSVQPGLSPGTSYPHGFVFGSSRPASQEVTHPGIALVQARLTSEFSWDPKPVSLPKGLVLN